MRGRIQDFSDEEEPTMADPYMSEIRMMAFNYPPRGWAYCNGIELSIAQHQALFSLLGTSFGGDGRTTFKLPDLRGRAPMHQGPGKAFGSTGGEAEHTLVAAEVPGAHRHAAAVVSQAGGEATTEGNVLAGSPDTYRAKADDPEPTTLSPQTIAPVGGQAHENMQPYQAVPFCIALEGVYPSRD